MKNLIFILLSIFCITHLNLYSQNYTWKQRADYGGGEIYDPFSFVIGTKAYVGTGVSLSPTTFRSDFWEYDPSTNVWTQKANFLGTSRYGARGFAIGNYGYAGTGWTPSSTNDFYRYDPLTNSWMQMSNFSGSGRYTATSFVVGGNGYLGLGYTPCRNDFWRYNVATNSWTQVANYGGASRQAAASFVINDIAYVGTGLCPSTLYSDFYKYEYISNTWMSIANFPGSPRNAAYAFSINQKGYLGMGFNYTSSSAPYTLFNDFWEYDPLSDVWTQLPNFPGKERFEGVAFSINNFGYIGMGSDSAIATSYTADFWEYSPDSVIGINDLSSENGTIDIYPNPANDFVMVHFKNNEKRFLDSDIIKLFSSSGKESLPVRFKSIGNKIELDISELSNGLYHCVVIRNGKVLASEKFVKLK